MVMIIRLTPNCVHTWVALGRMTAAKFWQKRSPFSYFPFLKQLYPLYLINGHIPFHMLVLSYLEANCTSLWILYLAFFLPNAHNFVVEQFSLVTPNESPHYKQTINVRLESVG